MGGDDLTDDKHQRIRDHLRQQMRQLSGLEDVTGIELFTLLRVAANLGDAVETRLSPDAALSGPRFALLLRLYVEEQMGNEAGLTPTHLSHAQNVSKNTISSLLRGLEEQGLIARTLDPLDYRLFRIQLTPAGRELVLATAPSRLATLGQLAAGLTQGERQQLVTLLEKLCRSLATRLGHVAEPPTGGQCDTNR